MYNNSKREKEREKMFESNIQQLWYEWFEMYKPKKIKWIKWIIICFLIFLSGSIRAFFSKAGLVLIFASFFLFIIVACVVSGAQYKIHNSAIEFSWSRGFYDTGKNKNFPFMRLYAANTIGGKTFHYKNADVIIYDTFYGGKKNSPGLLIEMIPHYRIEEDNRLILCAEEIIKYQNTKAQNPKYYIDNGRVYIYVTLAAMGLIVDESGQLYPKTMLNPCGLWHAADDILHIINNCFAN